MLIHQYISEAFAYALGWTIVHSLWQALAIGLLLFVALHFTKKQSATTRYWLSSAALLSVLGLAVFTFTQLYQKSSSYPIEELTYQASEQLLVVQHQIEESPVNLWSSVQHWLVFFDTHINLISSFWFIGLLFFVGRLLFSFAEVRLLRTQAQPLNHDFWTAKAQRIATDLGIRKPIPLLESAHISMPMMLGYFKPIVLLPIGTINALTPEQVEAVLAHELAHIARHDYLFNILQSIIEVLFFFNPVVWWMSANVRTERENCCDDLALQICGDSLTYAKSLVHLQELEQSRMPQLALALFGHKKQLLQRVQRILNHPQSKSSIMEKLTATGLLLLALCFYSATTIWQTEAASPIETETTEHFELSDALPKVTCDLTGEKEGKTFHLKMEDGMVESLKIDGTAVPATELKHYGNYVVRILDEMPVSLVSSASETAPSIRSFRDTIPNMKGTANIQLKDDDENVAVKIKDGVIKSLKIDGKAIPEEEFADYEDYVIQLLEDVPVPPVPPAPPAPPALPNIDGIAPPPPPAPPAPPAPPSFGKEKTRIEKRIDEGGNVYLRVFKKGEKEPTIIKINENDDLTFKGTMTIEETAKEGERIFFLHKGSCKLNGKTIIKENKGSSILFETDEDISFSNADATLFEIDDNAFDLAIAGFDDAGIALDFATEDLAIVLDDFDNIELPDLSAFENIDFSFGENAFHFDMDSLPAADRERMEEARERLAEERERMAEFREEFQEEHRARLEEARERLAEERERMQAMNEERRAHHKEQYEEMKAAYKVQMEEAQERMKEAQAEMRERHEEMRELHLEMEKAHHNDIGKLKSAIGSALVADGIIKNAKKYKFQLTDTSLEINGEKQASNVFQKYKALVESMLEYELEAGDEVKIKSSGNSVSTSLNIDR